MLKTQQNVTTGKRIFHKKRPLSLAAFLYKCASKEFSWHFVICVHVKVKECEKGMSKTHQHGKSENLTPERWPFWETLLFISLWKKQQLSKFVSKNESSTLWISLAASNWQHVLLWLGGIHAISGHFKIAPSQWIPSISLLSFLIPGDWNICQDDWTSIEWYGRGGERRRGCRSCQQWWLRQSESHQDVMSITQQPAFVCDKAAGHTQASHNTWIGCHFSTWWMFLSPDNIIAACIKVVHDNCQRWCRILMAYGNNIRATGSCLIWQNLPRCFRGSFWEAFRNVHLSTSFTGRVIRHSRS